MSVHAMQSGNMHEADVSYFEKDTLNTLEAKNSSKEQLTETVKKEVFSRNSLHKGQR